MQENVFTEEQVTASMKCRIHYRLRYETEDTKCAYLKAHNCRPPPIFIPLVVLAEIVIFVYYADIATVDNDTKNYVTAYSGIPKGSSLTYYPQKRYEVWRFLTCMFIHLGYVHLINNGIIQLFFGCVLEVVHKFWRVGIIFLGGVIGSVMAHTLTTPDTYFSGSSGGSYALVGAQYAVFLLVEMPPIAGQQRYRRMFTVDEHIGVNDTNWNDLQTHWRPGAFNYYNSGYVRLLTIILFGFLLGMIVLRTGKMKRWLKIGTWSCIVLLTILALVSVIFHSIREATGQCLRTRWH